MPTKMVYDFEARPISTLEEGAEATLRLAIPSDPGGVTGVYFDGQHEPRAHEQAYSPQTRTRLSEMSDQLCGLAPQVHPCSAAGGTRRIRRGLDHLIEDPK